MLRRNPDPPTPQRGQDARDARIDDGVRRLAQTHNREVTRTTGSASGVLRVPTD